MKDSVLIQSPTVSFQVDRRLPVLLLTLAILSCIAIIVNVQQGEYPISTIEPI